MDIREQMRVRGRLALVTGASGGIGKACARALAREGVHLALTYSTNKQSIESLLRELEKTEEWPQLRISTHQVDLARIEDIEALLQDIKVTHQRSVDILVANAGFTKKISDIEEIEAEDFEYTCNVNLKAPYLLAKAVVGGMKKQKWGRMVFVSSIAAHGGGVNGCHYAASKGGLTGMMKNLSARLAEHNISVNDVAPALIGNTGTLPAPQWIPQIIRSIPLGRLGDPEEVAEVVLMLAKTGYVTGQSIIMGGGLK